MKLKYWGEQKKKKRYQYIKTNSLYKFKWKQYFQNYSVLKEFVFLFFLIDNADLKLCEFKSTNSVDCVKIYKRQ